MKLLFGLFLISILIACESKQKTTKSEVHQYVDEFVTSYINTIDVQIRFTNNLEEALKQIRNNEKVDTSKLHLLLDSSIQANIQRMRVIEPLEELDKVINAKEITMNALAFKDSVYKNEFKTFIKRANISGKHRKDSLFKILMPIYTKLDSLERKSEEVMNDLRIKYEYQN